MLLTIIKLKVQIKRLSKYDPNSTKVDFDTILKCVIVKTNY
jgi:hypothetical protein